MVTQQTTVHVAEHVQSGQFAFTAQHSGDYVACFWGPEKIDPPVNLTIDFEWKTGVAAKDWPNIAKKRHIEVSYSTYIYPVHQFFFFNIPFHCIFTTYFLLFIFLNCVCYKIKIR